MGAKANPTLLLPFFAALVLDRDTADPGLVPDLLKKDSNDLFCELSLVFFLFITDQ